MASEMEAIIQIIPAQNTHIFIGILTNFLKPGSFTRVHLHAARARDG